MRYFRMHRAIPIILELAVVALLPFLLAMSVIGLWNWDFSVPMIYTKHDDVWPLVLTKVLVDTGWVLDNPYLGAPDIAHWQYHAAAQTSAIHSLIMLALSQFIDDAVRVQQVYYLLNFSLISLASYLACRLLGISKIASASVAMLFAFTNYRIQLMFYAFIPNYFAVPLSLVPVFWILTGQFAAYFSTGHGLKAEIIEFLRSRKFWISSFSVLLVTLSDGYYAFFTLLLLVFSAAMRAIYGDIRKPARLIAPVLFIALLISTALLMSLPLAEYKRANPGEFYPGGKADTELFRKPMEAEVYS